MNKPLLESLLPEIIFSVSRSSGPGGQHVNKVNTRVTLKLDIPRSMILTDDQKRRLLTYAASRISQAGILMLSEQQSRSQSQNKDAVLKKLDDLLTAAFKKRKARKPTSPTKASKHKRLENKKRASEKKQWRKKF